MNEIIFHEQENISKGKKFLVIGCKQHGCGEIMILLHVRSKSAQTVISRLKLRYI